MRMGKTRYGLRTDGGPTGIAYVDITRLLHDGILGRGWPSPTWGVRLGRVGSWSNGYATSVRNNEQWGES
jgi:hypothetical protein